MNKELLIEIILKIKKYYTDVYVIKSFDEIIDFVKTNDFDFSKLIQFIRSKTSPKLGGYAIILRKVNQ